MVNHHVTPIRAVDQRGADGYAPAIGRVVAAIGLRSSRHRLGGYG
jgi:hypothetical protein